MDTTQALNQLAQAENTGKVLGASLVIVLIALGFVWNYYNNKIKEKDTQMQDLNNKLLDMANTTVAKVVETIINNTNSLNLLNTKLESRHKDEK